MDSDNGFFGCVVLILCHREGKSAQSIEKAVGSARVGDDLGNAGDGKSFVRGLGHEVPDAPPRIAEDLESSKLTCEDYVAYVTVEVVGNMDAIAWA